MTRIDMDRLCEMIETELNKISEKGMFTASTLDTAYKLIDMYKDLKNTEYWDDAMGKGEYSEGGRHRDRMGRYASRGSYTGGYDGGSYNGGSYAGRMRYPNYSEGMNDLYEQYQQYKGQYRNNKTPECKQRLMETLDSYMNEFEAQMEEMLRDSECAEERQTIKNALNKIRNI